MAVKAGEVDYGLAVGVEKLAGAGLLAGGSKKADALTWTPARAKPARTDHAASPLRTTFAMLKLWMNHG